MKKFLIPTLIIVVLAAAIFTYLTTRNPHPNLPQITDISDWQTYNNPKWGVSFKYPKELKLCVSNTEADYFTARLVDIDVDCLSSKDPQSAPIGLSIQKNYINQKDSQSTFQLNYKENYNQLISGPFNHLGPFSIDGLEAFGGEFGNIYRGVFTSSFDSYIVTKDHVMNLSSIFYYQKQGSKISGYKPQFDAFLKSISFGDRWR